MRSSWLFLRKKKFSFRAVSRMIANTFFRYSVFRYAAVLIVFAEK